MALGGVGREYRYCELRVAMSVALTVLFAMTCLLTGCGPRLDVGAPMPDAYVRNLDGSLAHLASLRGSPLWINFFATWCGPCVREMPEIERHYMWDAAQGLNIVGVDLDESREVASRFVDAQRLTFPVVVGRADALDAFDVHSIPTSVFVDSNGVVREIVRGQMSGDEINQALKTILPNYNGLAP